MVTANKLMNLIRENNIEGVELALQEGANVQEVFFNAAFFGHLDLVQRLINERDIDVNQTDTRGTNVLFWACASGNIDLVQYLVNEKGMDIHEAQRDGGNGLFAAAFGKHINMVKYLVEEKDLDIKATNNHEEDVFFPYVHNAPTDDEFYQELNDYYVQVTGADEA